MRKCRLNFAEQNDKADTSGRLALLFTILTGARSGEVREARWSQIDLGAKEWRRPAEMMRKTDEAHTVTLSREAIDILKRAAMHRTVKADCLVFPGAQGGHPRQQLCALPGIGEEDPAGAGMDATRMHKPLAKRMMADLTLGLFPVEQGNT